MTNSWTDIRNTDLVIIMGGNAETMAWAMLQHKYATRLDVPHQEWTDLVREIEEKEKMKEQGRYVKSIALSSTMGPGVRVDPASVEAH